MKEVQFFELSSDTNTILNACSFEYCGIDRLILASRNQLLSLGSESGKFSLQELPLEGVPEDSEITSLAAFADKTTLPVIAVGLTQPSFVVPNYSPTDFSSKMESSSQGRDHKLFIYSSQPQSYLEAMDLSNITQVRPQSIDIGFTPLRMMYCQSFMMDMASLAVTGSDSTIHFFKQNVLECRPPIPREYSIGSAVESVPRFAASEDESVYSEEEGYSEDDITSSESGHLSESPGGVTDESADRRRSSLFEMFPVPVFGFDSITSPILSLDSMIGSSSVQFFAGGCENGDVVVTAKRGEESYVFTRKFQGPISCVEFVGDNHLVVGGTLGFAAVMKVDLDDNASLRVHEPVLLPGSTEHDAVLCSAVSDVDWDGEQEVLIGTYGEQLLAYSRVREGGALSSIGGSDSEYVLDWTREFAHPIYSIKTGDFNQDGAEELVVNTLRGVHILQPDLQAAAKSILVAVENLEQLKQIM